MNSSRGQGELSASIGVAHQGIDGLVHVEVSQRVSEEAGSSQVHYDIDVMRRRLVRCVVSDAVMQAQLRLGLPDARTPEDVRRRLEVVRAFVPPDRWEDLRPE